MQQGRKHRKRKKPVRSDEFGVLSNEFGKLFLDKFGERDTIFFGIGAISYFSSIFRFRVKRNRGNFSGPEIQSAKGDKSKKRKGGSFEVFRFQLKRQCSFNPNPELRR